MTFRKIMKKETDALLIVFSIIILIFCSSVWVMAETDEEQTVFTPYIQYAGKNYLELEDGFDVEGYRMGGMESDVYYLTKRFYNLPGEWTIQYLYYRGDDMVEDGILFGPSWKCPVDKGDTEEILSNLIKVYGDYNEVFSNPLPTSKTPYESYLWYSVESGQYSLCLTKTDQKYLLYLGEVCHEIEYEELSKAVYKEVIKLACEDIDEKDYLMYLAILFNYMDVKIEEFTRLDPTFVNSITTNDLGGFVERMDYSEPTSDYVLVTCAITEKGRDDEIDGYNIIMKYCASEWKVYYAERFLY